VGHITPEAHEGGAIALVKDGDQIELDATKNTITLKIGDDELARRKAAWKQPPLKATNGILFKYARQVKTAAEGCVTDEL
jgi:dihydroxy-acid dehydratase